ncbi:uncharacterized protein G2W53_044463 [Senna tora]|uniref:Uncharacterized protein n=1 Tax=Senna tora TaxID=362788 RepID=A0A834SHR9_9FABA|nr:uncharacterized protein G2W53_044463 [Senna tora]
MDLQKKIRQTRFKKGRKRQSLLVVVMPRSRCFVGKIVWESKALNRVSGIRFSKIMEEPSNGERMW